MARIRRALYLVARWARRHLALWILAAGAVVAALVVLVTVLITLPGQQGGSVRGLILALLALLALSVAFPVVGRMVEQRDRAAEREQQRLKLATEQEQTRRGQAAQLLVQGSTTGLPLLSDLADDVLGATPTRYSIEGVAPYVARPEADQKIRNLLSAPGPPYPFVIVWGTTKAGKSRTLAEALRATFTHETRVVLPTGCRALAKLVQLGLDDLVDSRPAVVVLDDVDPAGLEALTPDVLGLLRSWAVVAATMTARRRAQVLASGGDIGAVTRAALAAASGEYELLSEPPVGVEKAEAERLYPAERFDGSIAETLVGARELISRYKASRDSHPAGCAVVRAAVDIRRAGVSRPVTATELRRLFPLYMRSIRAGRTPTDKQFNAGIEWATRPVTSQVALLRLAAPGQEPPAWLVFDHAVTADEGDGGPRRAIPAAVWTELVDMLLADDALAVGKSAFLAGHSTIAVAAFRKAANSSQADSPMAASNLGFVLKEMGDFDGGRAAYQQAIDCKHSGPSAWFGADLLPVRVTAW